LQTVGGEGVRGGENETITPLSDYQGRDTAQNRRRTHHKPQIKPKRKRAGIYSFCYIWKKYDEIIDIRRNAPRNRKTDTPQSPYLQGFERLEKKV